MMGWIPRVRKAWTGERLGKSTAAFYLKKDDLMSFYSIFPLLPWGQYSIFIYLYRNLSSQIAVGCSMLQLLINPVLSVPHREGYDGAWGGSVSVIQKRQSETSESDDGMRCLRDTTCTTPAEKSSQYNTSSHRLVNHGELSAWERSSTRSWAEYYVSSTERPEQAVH
ncbi:hypothetical protein VTK26DRAFT_8229 [Humicola hyalothermophila]